MTKRYTVEFSSKVTPVKPLNDEFTLCKCYVMALNKNRNLSFIAQSAADAAQPTIYNIPVIGHLYVDDAGEYHMGGHDMVIAQDSEGNYGFKSLCVPYGVVPQQDNIHYEEVEEANGDTNTYLVADVILWTGRFPELKEAIYNDQTYFGQSMEINVANYEPLAEDKNYTNILEYSYSALCLLGKSDSPDFHVEPCFPMARVDSYALFDGDAHFTELMDQLKNVLKSCFANNEKGGEGMDENEIVVVDQPENIEQPETPVEVEQTKTEDVFEEHPKCDQEPENNAEGQAEEEKDPPVSYSVTHREKKEAIEKVLPNVCEYDEDGIVHEVYLYICDIDDTHVFVERYEFKRNEGRYEHKGRYPYTFNESDRTASITGEFEEMFIKWLTKDELSKVEEQRSHYEELLEYKESKIRAEKEAAIDSAISEFSDLNGNEEFATIVTNRYSYESVNALKDACYIIRGKSAKAVPQKKPAENVSVPVGTHIEPDIYEAFFARYGKRK